MLAEVINEIKLLRKLLESLGFSTTKYATTCILDIQKLPDYFSSDTLIIRMNNECVGNCSVYLLADGDIAILTTLDSTSIPEETVNQLRLLGFNTNSLYIDDWLTQRIIIEGTTNGNSTENT